MNAMDSLGSWLLVVLANAALQVTVIGLLAFVVLLLGRALSCQWRSGICTAALLAILACPLLGGLSQHLGLQWPGLQWSMRAQPVAAVANDRATKSDLVNLHHSAPSPIQDAPPAPEALAPTPPVAMAADADQGQPSSTTASPPAPRARAAATISMESWVLIAYVAGVAVMLLRLGIGQICLLRLRILAEAPTVRLASMLQGAIRRTGAAGNVQIGLSQQVAAPMLIGTFRPIILMPADMDDLPDSHIESILLHEIAHVCRRDSLINLLQRFAEAMFFFHPAVWLLGQELRLQRERCCDAWVITRTGRELDYARCLTDLAERLSTESAAIPNLAMAEFKHELPRRISAVLDGSARAARALPSLVLVLIVLGALGVASISSLCGLTLAAEPSPAMAPAANQPATSQPAASQPAADAARPASVETVPALVKVVDADGKPVADVKIVADGLRPKVNPGGGHCGWGRSASSAPEPVFTNAEGVATVACPKYLPTDKREVGYISFRASHPDYAVARPTSYAIDGSEPLVLEKGATLKVSGYIGSKDNIVKDVRVQVTDAKTSLDASNWQTLDSGVRVTRQLSPGKHCVRLGYHPADSRTMFSEVAQLDVSAGKEYTLHLELKPGIRLEGKLDASVPRPIRNGRAIIQAGPPGPPQKDFPDYREWVATTVSWDVTVPIAKDGTFVAESLPSGEAQVIGLCDGYVSKSPPSADARGSVAPQVFPLRSQTIQIALKMEPTASCTVRVVNEQGQPVENALVAFSPNMRWLNGGSQLLGMGGVSYEDLYRHGKKPDPQQYRKIIEAYHVRTDASGMATVQGLPGCKMGFSVDHGQYEPPAKEIVPGFRSRSVMVDLNPGKETTVTVTVQPKGRDTVETPKPAAPASPPATPRTSPADESARRDDYAGQIDPEGDRTQFTGRVIDDAGEPIEGVLVDAWTWYAGNETRTDKDGYFRLTKLDRDRRIEVRFSKEGYTPCYIVQQPTAVKDAVITLGNKTYFEGKVTDSKGQPVPDALIRITPPAQRADGVMITTVWTETLSDEQGRYRLYAQWDTYEFQVKATAGVARLRSVVLKRDQAKPLDIQLQSGVTFRAKVVDSQTHQPVEGAKLYSYQRKDVTGVSGKDGLIEIADMMPGTFQFQVEANGYARWWSAQCLQPYERYEKESRKGSGWQRNFDGLSFDLQPNMEPVTVEMEQAVRIRGKIVDPDGNPVAGATAAPALTGTGNSLTGDTRFSVRTAGDGTFEMLLPASNSRDYNLVAHDGKYSQWRNWANGVLPPIRTRPGEQIDDVVLQLTRPATVKGRVLDFDGNPVADRQVRAHSFDKLENRYYDPETRTNKDGTFELKFVRPGKHYVQAYPFWLQADDAPKGTSQIVTLEAGQTLEGIELTAGPMR